MNDIKSVLYIRLGVTFFVILIIGKFLGPLLLESIYNFFTKTSFKKNSSSDLDMLIESKKQLLRGSQQSSINAQQVVKNKNKTEEAYYNAIKMGDDENYAQVFKLFDNIKWGEGEIYSELQSNIKAHYKCSIPLEIISKSSHFILKKDLLLSLNTEGLPTFSQIKELIQVLSIFISIRDKGIESSFLHSKFFSSGPNTVLKAFLSTVDVASLEETLDKNPLAVLKSITPRDWDHLILKNIFNKDRSNFFKMRSIDGKIKEKEQLVLSLQLLPSPSSKTSLPQLYSILRVSENSSFEDIKKSYKKLAMEKHPDKFTKFSLSKKLQTRINDNFKSIQVAYDTIKSKQAELK